MQGLIVFEYFETIQWTKESESTFTRFTTLLITACRRVSSGNSYRLLTGEEWLRGWDGVGARAVVRREIHLSKHNISYFTSVQDTVTTVSECNIIGTSLHGTRQVSKPPHYVTIVKLYLTRNETGQLLTSL